MVHSLLGAELGDGRENTAGVAGEQDDVLGVTVRLAGNLGVLDVLDGVGAAGVLGQGVIVVVDNTGGRVEDDVLEDGAEFDGVENVRLLLGGETDGLCVAAALDVEDAGVGPAVLVVANELALGVGGQGGLASTGQTKEDSDITVLALVGGRVESEDVVLDGHFVEEDCEDTLLHLTGVLGSKNNHLLIRKVDGDGCSRGHTAGIPVGREGATIVDDIVRMEVLQLLSRRADQHVAHEESVIRAGAHDTDADPVALVPSCEAVDDVDALAGVEVVDGTLAVDAPDLRYDVSDDVQCTRDASPIWTWEFWKWRPAQEMRGSRALAPRARTGVEGLQSAMCLARMTSARRIHEPFSLRNPKRSAGQAED